MTFGLNWKYHFSQKRNALALRFFLRPPNAKKLILVDRYHPTHVIYILLVPYQQTRWEKMLKDRSKNHSLPPFCTRRCVFWSSCGKMKFYPSWSVHLACLRCLMTTRHAQISNSSFRNEFGAWEGLQKSFTSWVLRFCREALRFYIVTMFSSYLLNPTPIFHEISKRDALG
jgi:hypothetical protein